MPPRWKPPSTTWLNGLCRPPYAPTSLTVSISTVALWLWSVRSTSSSSWQRRSVRVPGDCWRCKISAEVTSSSRWCRSPPKRSGVKPRMPWKLQQSWRRTWPRPLWICTPCVLPAQTPSLWLLGEPLPKWGRGTHQEDSNHLTNTTCFTAPQAGPSE